MSKPLPKLTHLQFLILGIILGESLSGKRVREELERAGARKSGSAFYQIMARLEDDALVRGWYEQDVIDGQILRERWYAITAAGRRTWSGSRDFYLDAIGKFGDDPVRI